MERVVLKEHCQNVTMHVRPITQWRRRVYCPTVAISFVVGFVSLRADRQKTVSSFWKTSRKDQENLMPCSTKTCPYRYHTSN